MKARLGIVLLSIGLNSAAYAFDQAKTNPQIQLFQGDGTTFVLREPLVYMIESTREVVYISPGFVTDFASVPWFAQSVVSVLGRHSVPAILHDYLYWQQKCTRKEADLILFETMDEYRSSWLQKHAVYWSVRMFGRWAWAGNEADRRKGLIKILPRDRLELPENKDWKVYRQELLAQGVKEEPDPATLDDGDNPSYCSLKQDAG